MLPQYSYKDILHTSERIAWRVEDLIGPEKSFDFSKPFLPDSLAGTAGLNFLSPRERVVLNQIRGFGYLCMFGLVEEFILPFVLDHARPQLQGDDYRTRALLAFAGEEAKHIHLFKEFRRSFETSFGSPCGFITPPEPLMEALASRPPLSVAITILHIEWMTQRHYLDSVRGNSAIDPLFESLLRHHWMEEAGHAKLDTLMVLSHGEYLDKAAIAAAIEDYLAIGGMLDDALMRQVELDVESFAEATGRILNSCDRAELVAAQQHAMRWTFLGSGMTHPKFLATLEELLPAARARIEQVSPAFC